jgi:hypothetical protein
VSNKWSFPRCSETAWNGHVRAVCQSHVMIFVMYWNLGMDRFNSRFGFNSARKKRSRWDGSHTHPWVGFLFFQQIKRFRRSAIYHQAIEYSSWRTSESGAAANWVTHQSTLIVALKVYTSVTLKKICIRNKNGFVIKKKSLAVPKNNVNLPIFFNIDFFLGWHVAPSIYTLCVT